MTGSEPARPAETVAAPATPDRGGRGVTAERPVTSTPDRALLTVAGTLAMVLLLNQAAFWLLGRYTTNFGTWLSDSQWRRVEAGVEQPDWLIFGDSSAVTGVVASELTEMFGERFHNLATFAAPLPVNDAWMLDRYIELHGPPKNVLIVHTTDVWHRAWKSEVIARIPQPWGFWERLDPPIELELESLWRIFKGKYFVLFAEKDTAGRLLKEPSLATERWFAMDERGFVPGRPHNPHAIYADLARSRTLARKGKFRLSKTNRSAIEALCRLSSEHEVDVYLAAGPLHRALKNDRAFSTYRETVVVTLGSAVRSCPRVHLVPDQFYFRNKDFDVHVDHLVPERAPAFTRMLGQALTRAVERVEKGRAAGRR